MQRPPQSTVFGNLRVTNITASFKVDKCFDLSALCQDALTNESRVTLVGGKPKKFNSVVQRLIIRGKIVTALIYKSGGVVLVGGKTKKIVREAMSQFLVEHNCQLRQPLTFSNFAMTFSVPHNLDLIRIYKHVLTGTSALCCPIYEVELFPSLLLTKKNTSTKASIFHTGRVIVTGCRTPKHGQRMYSDLQLIFNKFIEP